MESVSLEINILKFESPETLKIDYCNGSFESLKDDFVPHEKYDLELFTEDREIARFAHLAYEGDAEKIKKILNGTSPDLRKDTRNVFNDWKLICTATNKVINYFGAAFLMDGTESRHRQIIISHRGTHGSLLPQGKNWLSNFEGVVNNVPTSVMNSACTFVQEVITSYKSHSTVPAQVIITGHSLGGWLAQISCFSIKYLELIESGCKCLENNRCNPHCITFDSPGAQPMLELLNAETVNVDSLKLDITNYVIFPNLVNVINGHFGDLVKIPTHRDSDLYKLPADFTLKDLSDNAKHTTKTHSMKLFLTLLQSEYEGAEEEEEQESSGYWTLFVTFCKDLVKRLARQRRLLDNPVNIEPTINTLFDRVIKHWPQVVYSKNKLNEGVSYVGTLWGLSPFNDGYQGYQAYLLNGQDSIKTEKHSTLDLLFCQISKNEQNFINSLTKLEALIPRIRKEEDKNDLEHALKVIFPLTLPLFMLTEVTENTLVWPFSLEEKKIVFHDKAAFLRFKNTFVWNEGASFEQISDINLWHWVNESVRYYNGLRKDYITPEFDDNFPKLEDSALDVMGSKDELTLLILSILRNPGEYFILKFTEEDEHHFTHSINILKNNGMNSTKIVIDFSKYKNSTDNFKIGGNVQGKIYRLIPAKASSDEKKFALTRRTLEKVLQRKVISEDLKGGKCLSDLVDLEVLKSFLEKYPETTLSLLKKDEEITMDPLTQSVFDSRFTYFQVGEIYSFHTTETMVGLTDYYGMVGESSEPTIIVFVIKSANETSSLQIQKVFKGFNVVVNFIAEKSDYFYSFTRFCKTNANNFVDLIRCHVSSEKIEEWRFEHLYQYNPKFYFDRKIVPPPIYLPDVCKGIKVGLDGQALQMTIDGKHIEQHNVEGPSTAVPAFRVLQDLLHYLRDFANPKQDGRCPCHHPLEASNNSYTAKLELTPNIAKEIILQFKFYDEYVLYATFNIKGLPDDKQKEMVEKGFRYNPVNTFYNFHYENGVSIGDKKFSILSDEPGMGKSTTVAKMLPCLANETTDLVVLIELKNLNHLDILNPENNNSLASFLKFISLNKSLGPFSEFLFCGMVLRKEFKLTVVFDGYDEMVEEDRIKFRNAIRRLWAFENVKVIISTRPNERTVLEAALCTFSHVFVPIKYTEDKALFLANIWAGILRRKKEELLPLAHKIIESAHEQLLKKRDNFLGVPLQLRILSEISLSLARKWVQNKSDEGEGLKAFINEHKNLGKIYEHFTNRKLEIYAQEKLGYLFPNKDEFLGHIKNSIQHSLYRLACDSLKLGEHFSKLTESCLTSFPDSDDSLLRTGIVYGSYNKGQKRRLQFLHKTFAEFYAAKCAFQVIKNICLTNVVGYMNHREDLISFVFEKFVKEDSKPNQVITDFFTSLIKDDSKVFKALESFSLNFNTINRIVVELVTSNPNLFLGTRNPCIAHFMMNGWTNVEIINYVKSLELHLAFLFEEQFSKVDIALSAILRRFCQYYDNDFKKARFLFREHNTSPKYFSLNDAIIFFKGECSRSNPFYGENIKDFISQWPVLSSLILGRDTHFQLFSRFESLFDPSQLNQVPFHKIGVRKAGSTGFKIYGTEGERNISLVACPETLEVRNAADIPQSTFKFETFESNIINKKFR